MQEYHINLCDALNHPSYSWPESAVTLPVCTAFPLDRAVLLDEHGTPVAYQASQLRETENGYCADLTILTAIPTGAVMRYTLRPVQEAPSPDGIAKETDAFFTIPFDGGEVIIARQMEKSKPFLRIHAGNGVWGDCFLQAEQSVLRYEAVLEETGPLYAVCALSIRLQGDRSLTLRIKAVKKLAFFEIAEQMQGFANPEEAWVRIAWTGFQPQARYTRSRKGEAIDAFVEEDGRLPFLVKPYSSWVSWWAGKSASFSDPESGRAVGIFVKNTGEWNDGKFALWESEDTLAVRFFWDEDKRALSWRYPLANGTRSTAIAAYASVQEISYATSPIDQMWFWHEYLDFNKVKDWVLCWDEDQSAYPRYFSPARIPESGYGLWHYGLHHRPVSPRFMEDMVYTLSHQMNQLWCAGAVSAREMSAWTFSFDMAAPAMSKEQFDKGKACLAFMAYAHLDENFMPTRHMLAGHPNFLADALAVGASYAALFPHHPHARRWMAAFERGMALNLKYHTRPAVKAWSSKGGRWTENAGAYNFASLHPMVRVQMLTQKAFGENVLLYPRLVDWADYMLNLLTAPVDGMRHIPPQGAHSGQIWDPVLPGFDLRILAESLRRYAPMLAQHLMYVCRPAMRELEERVPGSDLYRSLADQSDFADQGTRPPFKSAKYTGYGYILRTDVHDENEVSVHLQQIDDGPNYRWGRAAQGGCGTIYYYAAGRRYSYNRPEDIGDANMGDAQAGCNFGVLVGHEYRSVGRNELTRPLYDFGFAQYARVDAGPYSRPFYRYRSVLMSGNDYIVVHDAVGDYRVHGRFSWFAKADERLPSIVQLKPGTKPFESDGGHPIDEPGTFRGGEVKAKGVHFDGSGNFLTLVSHRSFNCDYNSYAYATEYGARIELSGRTDYVLDTSVRTCWHDASAGFEGSAGIVRVYGSVRAEAALFEGSRIHALGVDVRLDGSGGVGFVVEPGRVFGKVICNQPVSMTLRTNGAYPATLYLNGTQERSLADNEAVISMLPGETHWELTGQAPTPMPVEIAGIEASDGSALLRMEGNARQYQVQRSEDCGESWADVLLTNEKHCLLEGLENGKKVHLRVRGINETQAGPWSADYPLYPTAKAPEAPDGLRVWVQADQTQILWGQVLGARGYRLYRQMPSESTFTMIYEGEKTEFWDDFAQEQGDVRYAATAFNGNGESPHSNMRDTVFFGLSQWDPCPQETFRRYTRSHEYGYRGFDHWSNEKNPVLEPYPD